MQGKCTSGLCKGRLVTGVPTARGQLSERQAMDIFTMFLTSMAQRGIDWVVGRILGGNLQVKTICPKCQQHDQHRIGNQRSNYLECSNCHLLLNQYTNACDFTINRTTRQIGHVVFGVGNNQQWQWVAPPKTFLEKIGLIEPIHPQNPRLLIPYYIKTEGLRGRSVVFETTLRGYDDDHLIVSHRSLLTSPYDPTEWSNYWHSFEAAHFSASDIGLIIAVDARILSEYRDVIFEDRRVIKPWK